MGSVRAGIWWRLRRRGGLRAIVAAVAAAAAVSSCASAGSVGGTSPGPPATAPGPAPAVSSAAGQPGSVPEPAATAAPPFPAIPPVSRDAGSNAETSRHWVGYTFPTQNVTGVRAEWTEPTVTGRTGDEEFVWIGIGGWNQTGSNIIQAGTFVYFPGGGQTNEGVWYQRVPVNQKAIFPLVGVGRGDRIYASVVLLRQGQWRMAVDDVTIGSSFSIALPFQSLGAYPSFVVEDPDSGPLGDVGPFFPLPRWGSVTFSNVQVRVGRTWVAAASLPGIQISMVRGGTVLATAGPLSRQSSFSAVQS
jgi:hypothetical protein